MNLQMTYIDLDGNNIICDHQYRFRKKHSTRDTIIVSLAHHRALSAMNSGNSLLGIFLDFSKAFDTMNQQKINLEQSAIQLIKSYQFKYRVGFYFRISMYKSKRLQYQHTAADLVSPTTPNLVAVYTMEPGIGRSPVNMQTYNMLHSFQFSTAFFYSFAYFDTIKIPPFQRLYM